VIISAMIQADSERTNSNEKIKDLLKELTKTGMESLNQ